MTWGSASSTSIASWVVNGKPQSGSATKASTSFSSRESQSKAVRAGLNGLLNSPNHIWKMGSLLPRLPSRRRSSRAISRPSVAIIGGLPFEPESAAPASASECLAMKPRPRNEPSEWPRKMIGVPGCSAAIRRLKVQRSPTTLSHPPSSAKWPRSAARGLGPVAAMVVGVSRVARGVERGGETGVAGAVLGEAMGDLHEPRAEDLPAASAAPEGVWPSSARNSNSLSGILALSSQIDGGFS